MSSDVSITFDSNADKLTQSMTDLSAGITALGASFKQAAEKTKSLNDGLSDLDRAAQAQSQAWAVMAQGINSSLDLVKKGITGVKSAFDYLREGADISEAQQNFRAYAASIGKDADDLMKKMRQASKNQVSDMELMESATKALRLGVAKDYLVGEIVEVQSVNPARCTIISNIEWRWLQRFCPELLVRHPLLSSSDPSSESLNRCLNEVFRQKPLLKNNGLVRTCYYSGCDYSSITEAFSR